MRIIPILSRCTFLVIVLSAFTGPFIWNLIYITLADIIALSVGIIWALGDILPCIAICVLLFDLFILAKVDNTIVFTIGGRPIGLLDVIIIVSSLLYALDLILYIACHQSKRQELLFDCSQLLHAYRHRLFQLQVTISILYLTKPWNWKSPDLRKILTRLKRFNLLVYRVTHGLLHNLDRLQQAEASARPGRQLSSRARGTAAIRSEQSGFGSTDLANSESQRSTSTASNSDTMRQVSGTSRAVRRTSSRTARSTSSDTVQSRKSVRRVAPTTRSASSVRVAIRGASVRRPRPRTCRKLVIMQVERSGRAMMDARPIVARSTLDSVQSSRTVNLNLNMN